MTQDAMKPTSASTTEAEVNPKINQFVLYAERSIKLGNHSHALEGDVGVRSATAPAGAQKEAGAAAQLMVGIHGKCCDLFAPSTSLEIYSEARDVYTDSLTRVEDIGIGAKHEFPSDMPALPLAMALGRGADLTVARHKQISLVPGTYGAVTLLYDSELWLASGQYVFAALRMDEGARLLADPGGVELGITDSLWTDKRTRVATHQDEAGAKDFSIAVAGSDETDSQSPAGGPPNPASGDQGAANIQASRSDQKPVVVIGEEADIHALLAAPHGTVLICSGARVKGAIAGFDIDIRENVHAEFQNGFPINPKGQQGSQQLSGYFRVPDPSVAPLAGPVPNDTAISLAFGLPVRTPAELAALIASVSDPKSASFRKFITQVEFKTTYGATDSDYTALKDWAANVAGFTIVATYSNNLLLSVSASAALIEQALYVNLVYRTRQDGSLFVTVDRNPSLNLAVKILEINGLNDYILPTSNNGTGSGGTFAAADLRNAYIGVNSPLQSLDGSGQVVGIVDFATFNASDITSWAQSQVPAAGQPALPVPNATIVATEGGNPAPNSAIEATGDVELVLAMAPNAQILFFQGNSGITAHLDDIFHAMATSATPLTVVSCSLGFQYSDNVNQAIGQMAANGVSMFMASGDSGSSENDSSNNFANQTLVGGTILSTNAVSGGVYPTSYYAGETTWPGSAGGILGVPIPDYQQGVSMATNNGSTTSRNYPDVAMVAIGLEVFFNGSFTGFNGTSAGAPLWAGFTALVNQANAQAGGPGKSGFLNPTIYDIGLTSGTADDLYSICFNDIVSGNNGAFTAVSGYDLCTGWGTPKGALINQLSSQTPLTNNQPLTLIRFVITTGQADLGGGLHGSGATATVALKNGDTFTVTLKTASQSNWNNGSINTLDFTIPATDDQGNMIAPLTQSNGIAGVTINQVQSNPGWSANNWDIAALQVSLFNPGSPHVCQLNLVGTSVLQDGSIGLVRLSLTAGSSGNGPSSPEFITGPSSGC
jgi:hypothetical protein